MGDCEVNLFEGFMASATVLIMQQTQTQTSDLPAPLSDQKIPLHQVKIRDEDSAGRFERVFPSASGPRAGPYSPAARSRKVKNGNLKKPPQRGLGVAQLEKMRLQDEKNRQEQASCLAYAHMAIPLDSTSCSFLHLHGVRPGAGYIDLSPKLTAASMKPGGSKSSPAASTPASTISPQGWDRLTAASVALLRPPQDGNSSTNPYPSRYCADRKPGAGRFEEIEEALSASASSSSVLLNKSPFLLSKATQRVFAETEGYSRTLKASVDVYPVKVDHDQKLFTTSTMGTAGAIKNKKMAFVDLNSTESVSDIVSSPSLRAPQLLRFQDGKQSVNGNTSSKELSSFQKYTYHRAWFQTNKIPSKKRSRDSTQENITNSPRSLAYALSVVPSDQSGHSEDGARSRTEIQRNSALASADNSSFLNLNKQEMPVCSPDREDGCPKGDAITVTKKDFLELSLSSSCFSGELDRKQEVHEHSVQDSNSIQVNESHKCSKIGWFNAFHQKAIANDAETAQHLPLPCQKMMGECETRRFSSSDIPISKKLLVAEPSTQIHDSESNLQHFGANVCTGESTSISVVKVMTNEHQDPSKHIEANAEVQILLPKDSLLNLSLDLSL